MKHRLRQAGAGFLALVLLFTLASCGSSGGGTSGSFAEPVAEIYEEQEQITVEDLTLSLQQQYKDEEPYVYTDPLYDLEEDHTFTLSLGFTPSEKGYTKIDQIVGIYQDMDFTRRFYVGLSEGVEKDGRWEIEMGPPREAPFGITSTLYEYSRYIKLDLVDHYLFQKEQFSSWGNGREYYMVQWVDYDTGEPLQKPIVTVFTTKHELAAPQAEFYVTGDGSAAFRWNEVEGATMYYIVEAECSDGMFDTLTPIGRSDTTSWVYNNEGLSFMNSPFRMEGSTEDDLVRQQVEEEKRRQEEERAAAADAQSGDEGSDPDADEDATDTADADTDEPAEEDTGEEDTGEEAGRTWEDYATKEKEVFYGVIAVNDTGASVVSRLYSENELAALLPYGEAYYTKQQEGISTGAYESIGLLPAQMPVIMCDNKIVRRTITYDIEAAKVRETTYLVYEGELEDPPPDLFDIVVRDVLYIPYSVDGTNLMGKFTFEEFNEDTYMEEMESLAQRQNELRGNSGTSEVARELELGRDGPAATTVVVDMTDNITANSALSEYLARNMIAGNQIIDLSGFKESSNRELLLDAWQEAIYQNPLILGVKSVIMPTSGNTLTVNYYEDNKTMAQKQQQIREKVASIIADIITPGMSDLQKEFAINQYLCDTSRYDQAALEDAQMKDYSGSDPQYNDSFTAYGVLINNVGVCASYSGAFKLLADAAGLDCIVVTGLLNGSVPHAWNRVNIGGEWHTVDVTNNNNPQIANALLNLPDHAASMVLLEDDKYVLNSALSKYTARTGAQEFYRVEGRYYTEDDIVEQLVAGLEENDSVTLRTDYDLSDADFQMIANKVMAKLWGTSLTGYTWMGVIHLVKT